ncbi:MAG: TetR/AcrR family transcriptional regulator [Alphaproteobacteria bacterium]|nr:TetR/AcrR family transcriptional regulator [Alphaproteobacteria bacterium]
MARASAMDPDERRAAILAAARRVFVRKGYHRAGVADIVQEVGVARGTFYRYFEGKREVFAAVLGGVMDEVVGVVRPIDVTRPIPEQIRANLDRLVRAVTDEDVVRVLFAEAQGIDDEGDAALRDFYGAALGRIEAALRTGQALGVVRAGDTRLLARCLLGLIKEPVVQAALFGESLDAAGLVDEITAVLAGGIVKI